MVIQVLLVAAGGAAGAAVRWLLAAAVQRWAGDGWPVGVLAVNVLGCFLLGLLWPLAEHRDPPAPWRLPVLVGFLGAFTTFSTFAKEAVELGSARGVGPALLHVGLHNVFGLAAFGVGWALGRSWWGSAA